MPKAKKAFAGVSTKARFENPQQQQHIDSVAKNIAILTGQTRNKDDRAVLFRDLQEFGLVDGRGKFNAAALFENSNPFEFDEGDEPWNPRPENPHKPGNVSATPAFTTIMIRWDTPIYPGHSHAEIWRNTVDTLGNMDQNQSGGEAVLVGTSAGALYVDSVNYDTQYYYWVRFINARDIPGPVHGASGVPAKTFRSIQEQLDEVDAANLARQQDFENTFNQLVTEVNNRADDLYNELSRLDDTYVTDAYADQYIYTKVQADQAIAGQISAFQSAYIDPEFDNVASALSDRYTKAQANNVVAGEVATLRSEFYQPGTNTLATSYVDTLTEALITDSSAVAKEIKDYRVSYGGNSYSISQAVSISVDVDGDYKAQWGIQSSVGNLKHGIGFMNKNGKTTMMVSADNFAVFNPSNGQWKTAFTVENGRVFMSEAVIGDAFVGSLSVELSAVFEGDVLVNTRLTAAQIYGARIKGDTLWLTNSGKSLALDPSGTYPIWLGSSSYYNPASGVDNRNLSNAVFVFKEDGTFRARGLEILNDNGQKVIDAGGDVDGAWIKNASIETLTIKGNAVSVPKYIETGEVTGSGKKIILDEWIDLGINIRATVLVSLALHATRIGDVSGSYDKVNVRLVILSNGNTVSSDVTYPNVDADQAGDAGTVTHICPITGAGVTNDSFLRVKVEATPSVTSQSYKYKMIGFITCAKR